MQLFVHSFNKYLLYRKSESVPIHCSTCSPVYHSKFNNRAHRERVSERELQFAGKLFAAAGVYLLVPLPACVYESDRDRVTDRRALRIVSENACSCVLHSFIHISTTTAAAIFT